jgi:chromate reductase, NAD(P)H dehydrogenase (quinone)
MITIISGTNRHGSNTLKVAKEYQRILKEKGIEAGLFSLEGINLLENNDDFKKIEQEVIIPTRQFIFIVPEYNGSFPGVLKLLIDSSSSMAIWHNKEALLVGNSTGRAGNLRGLEDLTGILNHIKITVHPNKLPISQVNRLMYADGKFTDEGTLKAISSQLDEFIQWMK